MMRRILFILAFIGIIASVYEEIIYAQTETKKGHIKRIFYIHMGTVWVENVAFSIVFIDRIIYLWKGKSKWDILAY